MGPFGRFPRRGRFSGSHLLRARGRAGWGLSGRALSFHVRSPDSVATGRIPVPQTRYRTCTIEMKQLLPAYKLTLH
jgi:hypothetical protein